MIEETQMVKKMGRKFKDEPLGLEAGLEPLAVRQDLRTWVMVPSLWSQPHCSKECLYNHNPANAVFMGFQFSESISSYNKEELIIPTECYKL